MQFSIDSQEKGRKRIYHCTKSSRVSGQDKGSSINDVMQFWTFSDPAPPIVMFFLQNPWYCYIKTLDSLTLML
jgi:hypothetical protein